MLACSWQSSMATMCRPCCRCPFRPSPHPHTPLHARDLRHSPSQFARASPSTSTPTQGPASSLCKLVVNHPVAMPSHGQALCASSWRGILMARLRSFKPTLPKTPRHCLSIHTECAFTGFFELSLGSQAIKLEALYLVHCATVGPASGYIPTG